MRRSICCGPVRKISEGMTVTPYTFRASDTIRAGFTSVADEMSFYLYKLNVDAVFTDNPDRFPRK